jgi:hypothetical protein
MPSALLFYEYLITLRREIATVWGRRFSAATLLFLTNRYVAMLYGICLVSTDQARGQLVSTLHK